ncbi:unnamed protein product [Soboliphyme baturini]|uniref:Secreted protein n=1 Tax=Soboliphyme baturini TaxID=241478 RepID=A0A183J5F3_9BILA|nr:unnamed protein product [Soboliphyme baturini]
MRWQAVPLNLFPFYRDSFAQWKRSGGPSPYPLLQLYHNVHNAERCTAERKTRAESTAHRERTRTQVQSCNARSIDLAK